MNLRNDICLALELYKATFTSWVLTLINLTHGRQTYNITATYSLQIGTFYANSKIVDRALNPVDGL